MVTGRVVAENCFGTRSGVNAQELGADGHTGIGADFEIRAQAPHEGPPGALGHRTQNGAFLLEGKVPGLLGLHFVSGDANGMQNRRFGMDRVLLLRGMKKAGGFLHRPAFAMTR